MAAKELVEIKKGGSGYGLLIENDGYMKLDEKERKSMLKEGLDGGMEWNVPNPFIVDAVFQKYGIKNANGRIYPENILKREVEKYQKRIEEHRAFGECYPPDTLILTADGWKTLADVKVGDKVLTLNKDTKKIEIQAVEHKTEYEREGGMVRVKSAIINDVVTQDHEYPIFKNDEFRFFKSADEIRSSTPLKDCYIPKQGNWTEEGDDFIEIEGTDEISSKMKWMFPDANDPYVVKTSLIMPLIGLYLADGTTYKTDWKIGIKAMEDSTCSLIEGTLTELGLDFYIQSRSKGIKNYFFQEPRLHKFFKSLGEEEERFIPQVIKKQSKENLKLLYEAFKASDRLSKDSRSVLGKQRLAQHGKTFTTSKQLALDLCEIQLKVGYSGDIINASINGKPLYIAKESLSKGVYFGKFLMRVEKSDYKGKVMCVEVPNHIWYVMCNGKCHWTKNCNHPQESTIDLSRVSHNIIELHWEGHTLVGKMVLNVTEGFRRFGIVSSCGDQVANLLINGYKIGVSSRAVGSVTEKLGVAIVGEDLDLIAWDVVSDPSTPMAYISTDGKDALQPYLESDASNQGKPLINEKISKIKHILNS